MKDEIKYVDANIFLYPILYADEKAKAYKKIASAIAKREILACTSFLTWDEVVHIVKKYQGRSVAIREGGKFLSFPNLVFIRIDEHVIFKAQEIISEYNIRPRDAVHAASALISGAQKIISDDDDFDKIKELKRIKPY